MANQRYCETNVTSRGTGVTWEGFARIPYSLVFHPEITLADLQVFAALHRHRGQRRRTWISVKLLAQETGLHPQTVKKALHSLKQFGFITVEGRTNRRRVNIYLVHLDGQGPGESLPGDLAEMQTALNVYAHTPEEFASDLALTATENHGQGSLQTTFGHSEKVAETQTEKARKNGSGSQVSRNLHFSDGSLQATLTGGEGSLQATMIPSEDGAKTQTGTPSEIGQGCAEREVEVIEREKEYSAPRKDEPRETLQLGGSGKACPETEGEASQDLALDWRIFFTQSKEKPTGKQKPETIQAMILAVEGDLKAIEKALALRREELRTAHPSRRDAIEKEIQALEAERAARVTQLQRLRAELASVDATPPAPKAPKAAKVEKTDKKVPAFVQEAQNLDRDALMAELARREERVRTLLEKLETAQAQLKQAAPGEKAALETEIADLTGEIHAEKQRINLLKLQLGAFDVPRGAYQRVLEKTTEPAGKGKKQTKRAVTEKSTRKTHVFALHVKSTKREVCA